MKRGLVIALFIAALVFVTGCNRDGAGGNGGEIVTLRAYFPGVASPAQSAVLEVVNERLVEDGLNINIEVSFFDDYFTQLGLNVAAGQTMDLAWSHANYLGRNVGLGIYQPIDEALANYGPAITSRTPDFLMIGGQVDGVQYAMPRIAPMTNNRNVFNLRQDLRESYGLPPITTLDQLETFFAAVAENDPDVIPVLGWLDEALKPIFANYHFLVHRLLFVDPNDPTFTVRSWIHSPEAEALFATIWRWVEMGWLPESVPHIDSADAGFDTGQVAALMANQMRAQERIVSFLHNVPGGMVETVTLEPDRNWIFFSGDNQLAVPSTSRNVNEAVAFVNWFKSSQENFDLWSYGVEGVNWRDVDGAIDPTIASGNNVYSMNIWMWDDIDLKRFPVGYPQSHVDRIRNLD